jgi:hemolysin III
MGRYQYRGRMSLEQTGDLLVARPRLRGWLHEVAFGCAIPASAVLIVLARGATARIAAVVYGIGICTLFGVSASYHRGHWSAGARRRMKRLDHGTIFLMIAATYTPICLLLLRGAFGTGLLIGVWVGAVTGVALALTGIAEKRYVGFVCYLTLGWVAMAGMPHLLFGSGSLFAGTMLLAGGLMYTIGAAVLGRNWPNPYPKTFGYHEVWHGLVIAASALHYILILSLIRAG